MSNGLTEGEKGPRPAIFVVFLIFTAVVCGALVMVIEVLGSRVVGPFFGVSLFVWTSLITVTLVALALGYAAGGILSDRRSDPDYLYAIILVAGLLTLLIPHVRGAVLKASMPFGLRSGALVSSAILFGPALFLLGCVSPYIIKIAAKEMRTIGKTVGIFYAVSTVGSFIGTVVTGFVLIAYFSVGSIFAFIGMSLIGLSAAHFIFFRRKWVFLLLVFLPVVSPREQTVIHATMPGGTRVTRVFSADSFYGNVKVVDYSSEGMHTREMIIDGLVQGGIDVKNGMSVYEYSYFMNFLPYGLNPGGKNCLVVGLGGGVIPMWYEARGVRTDVVDIDPKVVEIARDYFGFKIAGDVIVSDARYFLAETDRKYDYIIVDVFNGDTTPGHVLSIEAVRLLKERTTGRGIVAFNLVGSLREGSFMTASIVRTLKEVFKTVKIYPAFTLDKGKGHGNIAVIACDYSLPPFDPRMVSGFPVHPLAKETVDKLLGREYVFPEKTRAVILSDDYNPIDFYDLRLKEEVRKNIVKTTDWDILI